MRTLQRRPALARMPARRTRPWGGYVGSIALLLAMFLLMGLGLVLGWAVVLMLGDWIGRLPHG